MKTRFFSFVVASCMLVMVACGNVGMEETMSLSGAICVLDENQVVSLEATDQVVTCGKISDGWVCRDSQCTRTVVQQSGTRAVSSALTVGETQVNPLTKSRGPCVPLTLVACCDEGDECDMPDGGPFVGRWICAPEFIDEFGWVHTSAESMPCGAGQECVEDGVFPNVGLCQDISSCTVDTDCDDSNQCTTDACVDGQCENTSRIGLSCTDGDNCTVEDTCVVTSSIDTTLICAGTDKVCDDDNQCTTDSCDATTGECLNVAVADSTVCDDGDLCTITDICTTGVCAGTDKVCDDKNICTTDFCDAVTGECLNVAVADSTVCDDINSCTTEDVCESGVCTGMLKSCDDSNQCTTDSCNPLTGECSHSNVADGTVCDDGLTTTGDVCVAGTCIAGGDWCQEDDADMCCLKPSGSQHQVGVCECNITEGSEYGTWVIATSCGYYEDGDSCTDNAEGVPTCSGECTPVCDGKVCGDDGCGGSCGTCSEDLVCSVGACVECVSDTDCVSGETCVANLCEVLQCTVNADCPEGQFCGGGYCYVVTDLHGRTGKGQSGASGGPLPDGTPDNWDDDGDCYCEVLPCLGTVAVVGTCLTLFGGDCDDTSTGFENHPGSKDWLDDNYDNDCDGDVDEG